MKVVREKELQWMRKQFWVLSFQNFSIWITPVSLYIAVFGVYLLLGNQLTTESAFTMISTVMIIQVRDLH